MCKSRFRFHNSFERGLPIQLSNRRPVANISSRFRCFWPYVRWKVRCNSHRARLGDYHPPRTFRSAILCWSIRGCPFCLDFLFCSQVLEMTIQRSLSIQTHISNFPSILSFDCTQRSFEKELCVGLLRMCIDQVEKVLSTL